MACQHTSIKLLLAGSLLFPTLFLVITFVLKRKAGNRINLASVYCIGVRSVSTFQSVLACCVGAVIVSNCHDVLYDRHWLTEAYTVFAFPYFYYDVWAMYIAWWHKRSKDVSSSSLGVGRFFRENLLMMFHHIVLPLILCPVILWFRRGLGDFFIGCFYMIEMAIPFISLRAVLLQLGYEDSTLYFINGVILILTFTMCRVLIFPFMYWRYGRQIHESLWNVPSRIPVKCNLGCLCLLLLQLHWLVMMIKVAKKTLQKRKKKRKLNDNLKEVSIDSKQD